MSTRPYRPCPTSLSIRENKRPGFSLRDSLIRQGVTTTDGIKAHMDFIAKTLAVNPSLNIRAYRVNPNNPNVPDMS